MRRLLLVLAVLVLVPFVYAPPVPYCGDGNLDPGEECDLPGNDSACPSYCDNSSCVCMKEVSYVLQDIYSGHNLLFSKAQDLAHMSKDQAFQDELKVIQYGLRQAFLIPPNNLSCNVVPALFMLTAEYSPYGKENEIDQFNKYLLFKLRDTTLRSNLEVSNTQYNESSLIQDIADQSLIDLNFKLSGSAKCCAYNQLIEPSVLGFRVGNRTCDEQPICGNGILEFPEQCDDGNVISGDGCNERCYNETCGDGIIQPLLNETCDPPDGGVTCNASCQFNQSIICGDGNVTNPPEECDPGSPLPQNDSSCPRMVNGSQICGITCHCEYCGNGVIDPGEECDDGGLCSDNNASCTTLNKTSCATPAAVCILGSGGGCSANCTSELCGDGIIQGGPPRFEECDPPNNSTCDEACHDPWCGDNVTQAWEECDPPGASGVCDSGICDVGCECQYCGNGILEDGEVCEVGIDCALGFSCTADCTCHICGDGHIDPGEQCGEPGLTCPAGQTCSDCQCSGGGTQGGGGSNKQLQYAAGCCKAFDYLAGSLAAEYYCCGGQDMTGPTGSHIDCCAEPELPQCRPYCTLMSCSPPYALDLGTQKCVMTESAKTTQAGADLRRPVEQTPCAPGYVLKDAQCVQKPEVEKPGQITKALGKGSIVNVATGILIFVAIALIVYMIVTRKRSVAKIELPKFAPVKKSADNLDAMKAELDDLEESYDKLEKVIKSMKGKV